jgi:hypothetical protein
MISTPTGVERTSETLPGLGVARRIVRNEARLGTRQEHVEDPVLRRVGRTVAHLAHFFLAGHFDGDLYKIADDRVYFPSNIADFSELRGLHFDKGRLGEPGEAAGDLGLAHACGADHQDVLRGDFGAQALCHLTAAPAVAQGDRDRALRRFLADDVLVELLDDLARGHLRHRIRAPRW